MSVEALTPVIRGILTAPDVDLRTISAKRVRKQILVQDPSLSEAWIKDNKEQIDKLIGGIFEEVAAASAEAASSAEAVNGKRKHEEIDNEPQSSPEKPISVPRPTASVASPTPAPRPLVKKETKSDEEVARQLAAELNTPRTRSAATEKPRPTKKAKAKKKSAAEVGSDGEEVAPKKAAKGGFQKEYSLSEPLADLMKTPKLSRPQVVKKLWEHIKGNELQNPLDRKEIICDDAMKAVFNVDKINMFQMNKVLGTHLYDAHET